MTTLSLKKEEARDFYSYDVERIISACNSLGYEIDYFTAKIAWEKYSEEVAATWLILPQKDENIFPSISRFLEIKN